MISVQGYNIDDVVYSSPRTMVYRGTNASGDAIVFKIANKNNLTPQDIARVRLEYKLLENINIEGIPRSLALTNSESRPVLVMSDMGVPFAEHYPNPLSIRQTLDVAISLVKILIDLHNNNIIHKDIKPANLTVNPQSGTLGLVDFDIASRLSEDRQQLARYNSLDGSLCYIAPEQTGRLNRPIDYRCDFYALGITLYQLIAGQPPFMDEDPQKLIYAHLALEPTPLQQQNKDTPKVLSELVSRLLQKKAEHRYISGQGLLDDIQKCLDGLNEQDQIPYFAIGQTDVADRFTQPRKIYGRDPEQQQLLASFDQATTGKPVLAMISGYSGIGKSSLVDEINEPLLAKHGRFIGGKFDQYKRDIPFSAVLQAINELMRQLLTGDEKQVRVWQRKIRDGVGTLGQVLIDIIPDLELIIGKQPAVAALQGEEASFRLLKVLEDFVHVFADQQHPLVLFLDDLQWADASSLRFLQRLLSSKEQRHLMVVGAYRDNEVNDHHPLMLTLDKISEHQSIIDIVLKPLDLLYSNQLVADTLSCEPFKTLALTETLHQKTQGNPFFLIQYLHTLHQQKLLTFDWQQRLWVWSQDKINALDVSDNVVDLMSSKINTLQDGPKLLMSYAGCLGTTFELNVLALVADLDEHQTAEYLWPALEMGLIKPLNDEYRHFWDKQNPAAQANLVSYKFVHDRIYEAAYGLIDRQEAAKIHLKIGRLLLANFGQTIIEQNIFDLCNHFNAGWHLTENTDELTTIAELNLQAGLKAISSAAYISANHYLDIGISIVESKVNNNTDKKTDKHYQLYFDLCRYRANCAFLSGDSEQAMQRFEHCLTLANSNYDKGLVYEMMVFFLVVSQRYADAIVHANTALKLFDIHLPENQDEFSDALQQEVDDFEARLKGKDIASLVDLPVFEDKSMALAHGLLQEAWTAGYGTRGMIEWCTLGSIKIANLSLKHGTTNCSSFGFMIYAMYLVELRIDFKRAYEFGELAIKLQEKHQHPMLTPKLNNLFGHFINHFVNPYEDNIQYYLASYQWCRMSGDLWWGIWAVMYQTMIRFEQGEELNQIYAQGERFIQYVIDTGNKTILSMHKLTMQRAKLLADPNSKQDSLDSDDFSDQQMVDMMLSENYDLGLIWHDVYASSYFFHRRQLDQALALTQRAEIAKPCSPGMVPNTTQEFYNSLILTACYKQASNHKKHLYKKQIANNLADLSLYAKTGPCNYLARSLLVKAEKARIENKITLAMESYDLAIGAAQQYGLIHMQGLCSELAGRFYAQLERARIATLYLKEAISCYSMWGAQALVKDIKTEFSQYLQDFSATKNTITPSINETTIHSDHFHSSLSQTERSGSEQTTGMQTTHIGKHSVTNSTTLIGNDTIKGNHWDISAILKNARHFALETDLKKLLQQMLSTLLENSGAQRVIIVIVTDDELTVEAQGDACNIDNQVMQALPLSEAELPHEILYFVGRTFEEVILDNACEVGMFTRSTYIKSNHCQSIACIPIINRGSLVAMTYVENNAAVGVFSSERIEILRFLSSQAAVSIQNSLLRNEQQLSNFEYRVGGSVDSTAPCYVARQADHQLYQAITNNEFCYVLNPRQMGKSSLRVHTMHKLEQQGYLCAAIDITSIGSQRVSIEQWYAGLSRSLLVGLKLNREINLRQWWPEHIDLPPVQRFGELIDSQILPKTTKPIAIFIDEIDSVMSLDFNPDDFFAAIRAMYNRRVDNNEYRRISFVLLGVALPYELIQDKKRTPFNIGVEIRLQGFRFAEAGALSQGLIHKTEDVDTALREILAWTCGQPFLTQKICRLLAQSKTKPAKGKEKQWVTLLINDKILSNWEAQDQPEHLITVRTRLLHSLTPQQLLTLYLKILVEGEIAYDASMLQEELILSGIVTRQWDRLTISNIIYSSVFNQQWVENQLQEYNQRKTIEVVVP